MALLLALAVNVGVATMVESFSRTFVTWLDGRLASDVYVGAKDDRQAIEIKAWLRERPEVQAILPGGRADTQLGGAPIEVFGLADHADLRDHWPLLEAVPEPGCGCGRAMRRWSASNCRDGLKLAVGDRIDMPADERQLAAGSGRHLCRLRQSQGPDRRELRGADAPLPERPANPLWPARPAVGRFRR